MTPIHRVHYHRGCDIHRLYDEDIDQDLTQFTELDEKYGDDFDGFTSYTYASSMDKPVYLVSGDTPRAKDDHYRTEDEGRSDGLLRVVALKPIVIDGYGIIGIGDRGGLIASEANLEQGTGGWVGEGAVVTDDALVADSALVMGGYTHPDQKCTITESSLVADGALVFDSHMTGHSSVEGNIEVYESVLTDNAFAYGDRDGARSTVLIDVILQDNATVDGNPIIRGVHMTQKSHVSGETNIEDSALIDNSNISGKAMIVNSIIGGDTRVYEQAIVTDSTIRGGSIICGDARVTSQLGIVDSVIN